MTDFNAIVTVTTATAEQAQQVLAERLAHDEDYGFAYTVREGALITPEQVTELRELLDLSDAAAFGDSNDAEIAAWRSAAEYAANLLGIPR